MDNQLDIVEKLNSRGQIIVDAEDLSFSCIIDNELINLLGDWIETGSTFEALVLDQSWWEPEHLRSSLGKQAKVILPPSTNIYANWTEFLDKHQNRKVAPDDFLILADSSRLSSTNKTKKLDHYLKVLSLIEVFSNLAEHYDETTHTFIFLQRSKLELPNVWSESEIDESLDGISSIITILDIKEHKQQILSLFKETIYSFLIHHSMPLRMKTLLNHFGEFSSRLTENYKYFVSEFSFDEVRDEYQEKKREYLQNINTIIDGVHTKFIGIPISIALVALRFSTNSNNVLINNKLILVAIGLYAFTIFLAAMNCKSTLNEISNEASLLFKRLKVRFGEKSDELDSALTPIILRVRFQRRILYFYILSALLTIFYSAAIMIDPDFNFSTISDFIKIFWCYIKTLWQSLGSP